MNYRYNPFDKILTVSILFQGRRQANLKVYSFCSYALEITHEFWFRERAFSPYYHIIPKCTHKPRRPSICEYTNTNIHSHTRTHIHGDKTIILHVEYMINIQYKYGCLIKKFALHSRGVRCKYCAITRKDISYKSPGPPLISSVNFVEWNYDEVRLMCVFVCEYVYVCACVYKYICKISMVGIFGNRFVGILILTMEKRIQWAPMIRKSRCPIYIKKILFENITSISRKAENISHDPIYTWVKILIRGYLHVFQY